MEKITSLQNPKIKAILRLKKAKEREKQGLVIIEGRHEISLALEAGIKLEKVYLCPTFSSDKSFLVELNDEDIVHTNELVFKNLSNRENPDGYLAVAKPKILSLDKIKLHKNPLVIIMESIEKPGNIGAILRTADAVKVDLIIINNYKTDIFNHNVIRSSLGTIFTNKVVLANIEDTLKWLKKHKITSFAATPHAKNIYFKANLKNPSAIVIGAEHEGLSQEWLSKVDQKIVIPMTGKIDSLNASVRAAVILFEAIRQRAK
jgi:RNA methyltransferase, TrmH family